MTILRMLLVITYFITHIPALISSENSTSTTLFSVIAIQNQHYETFQNLAQNATVTISSPNGTLQGTLTLDNNPSKVFNLSPETIHSLLLEWNFISNSKNSVSLWRSLKTAEDLIVRLNRPSQEELMELNKIHHFTAFNISENIKGIYIKIPNTSLVLAPKLSIPISEQRYFSIPTKSCIECDTSE